MSINLKAFHRQGNLLFNKVDIAVPTLGNNIYSRQMWNKSLVKDWEMVEKTRRRETLQDIKSKKWKRVGFTDSLRLTTNQTLFFVSAACQQTFLSIMWFSASGLKLTSVVSQVIDCITWWTWFDLERHVQIWVKQLHMLTHMQHTNSSRRPFLLPCSQIWTSS